MHSHTSHKNKYHETKTHNDLMLKRREKKGNDI